MALGLYESPVAEFLADFLLPGDVFFDIGAHAGYYTLLAGARVGRHGRVVAFEPNPAAMATLQQHVKLNGLSDRCTLEALAVSDRPGTAVLRLPGRAENATVVADGEQRPPRAGTGTVSVEAVRLDDYVRHGPRPSCVKVDVEGGEGRVLEGAQQLLAAEDAPIWIVAVHTGPLMAQVKSILQAAGYRAVAPRPLPHSTLLAVRPGPRGAGGPEP